MARIKIDFDDVRLRNNLQTFSDKLNRNVSGVMNYNSAYATNWLKSNAPWSDDTGAARTGLVALPFNAGKTHELIMAYSVSYGIWLEIANSGRYAVITPAMRIVGEKIMRDMQDLLDSMSRGGA
jgi:hypothetical protein